MITQRYPRTEYNLYITNTPYEVDESTWRESSFSLVYSVSKDSYVESGVDEQVTWYIAKSEPIPNINGVSFTVADTGDWYEDDYTRVEVTESEIIFTEKDDRY